MIFLFLMISDTNDDFVNSMPLIPVVFLFMVSSDLNARDNESANKIRKEIKRVARRDLMVSFIISAGLIQSSKLENNIDLLGWFRNRRCEGGITF